MPKHNLSNSEVFNMTGMKSSNDSEDLMRLKHQLIEAEKKYIDMAKLS